VNFWNPALPRYAGATTCYAGAYGKRLRSAFGFDQIEKAIEALSATPSTRQVVLQIWNPVTDFPGSDGTPASADIPCNVCAIVKIRNDKLQWLQVMRSNDIFRGTPYNFVQFTMVQEYMAGCLGVEVGDFVLVADSLHAYQKDIRAFQIAPISAPPSGIRISLPRADAKAALDASVSILDRLAGPDLEQLEFQSLLEAGSLPAGYADLVRVAAADSARRRGWPDLARAAAELCTDELLRTAWYRWDSDRATAAALRPSQGLC
jgi:thymidylate synthase